MISLTKYKEDLGRILILDGASGTMLIKNGLLPDKNLWTSHAAVFSKNILKSVYTDYIKAGADIITSNTFRTNPAATAKSHLDIYPDELVLQNIKLIKEASEELEKPVIIAGSNAPAEDCYKIKRELDINSLEYNHKKHIELLYENGADIILNETQSHLDEIEIICRFCSENEIPFIISLYFTSDFKLLSGEYLIDIINFVKAYHPDAISFNCIKQEQLYNFFTRWNPNYGYGYYLNAGSGDVTDENFICSLSPNEYLEFAVKNKNKNQLFIGGCCGTNTKHIEILREHIYEIN